MTTTTVTRPADLAAKTPANTVGGYTVPERQPNPIPNYSLKFVLLLALIALGMPGLVGFLLGLTG